MWQFSLYFEKEVFYYIKQLQENLEKACKGQKCCVRIFSKDNMFVLILALPKNVYEKQILAIKEKIIQSILLYYKPKTIVEEIQNFSVEKTSNRILLDVLCNFEKQSDFDAIFKKLSLCEKLYLSSFVQFSLREITKNWREMAKLIKQNSNFLNDEYTKFDLIRFLLGGVVSRAKEIMISKVQNEICILQDDIKISSFDNLFYFADEFDKFLFLIISKLPKTVTIKNYRDFDARFVNNLYNLFGDNLKLIE